jgi:flavin-dependent dehydrogenase
MPNRVVAQVALASAVDVLIVGAGVAGCALALGLRRAGVARVLLVDRLVGRADARHCGESATPDVAAKLAQLGLTPDLASLGHLPYYGNLSAFGSSELIHTPFLARNMALGHGWHLDRAGFNHWLRAAVEAAGAELACPEHVAAIQPAPGLDGWQVSLARRGLCHARVVVDAAGRRAPLARHLGGKLTRLDNLVALACRVPSQGSTGLDGSSLVETCPCGWWYAANVPGKQTVVMWMTDADLAKDADFLPAWQQTTHLARLVPRTPTSSSAQPHLERFAAHSSFLSQAGGSRWLALGDALLAFDPLTSSGIAAALSDASAAVPLVLCQLQNDAAATHAAGQAWAQRAATSLQRYIRGLRQHYGTEQRWPDQAFWARRIKSSAPARP